MVLVRAISVTLRVKKITFIIAAFLEWQQFIMAKHNKIVKTVVSPQTWTFFYM